MKVKELKEILNLNQFDDEYDIIIRRVNCQGNCIAEDISEINVVDEIVVLEI